MMMPFMLIQLKIKANLIKKVKDIMLVLNKSGSPRQQCIGAISVFVGSIDSHIILRMIRWSKMA